MGLLHHSQYFVYFEMGRTELLRQNGYNYRDVEDGGVFFVVAHVAAHFKSPARYDDCLRLTTRTTRLKRARIDHAYELVNIETGTLIATGESTVASVDRDGRLVPIPDTIFTALTTAG